MLIVIKFNNNMIKNKIKNINAEN